MLRMTQMVKITLPVELPIWGLISLKITRPELRSQLGGPQFVETDPTRTTGGEQDAWAFKLESGQRFLIIYDIATGWAELYGDPPDPLPLLQALGIQSDDQRLRRHELVEMK